MMQLAILLQDYEEGVYIYSAQTVVVQEECSHYTHAFNAIDLSRLTSNVSLF